MSARHLHDSTLSQNGVCGNPGAVRKAVLGPDYLKIGRYGRPPEVGQLREGDSRFQTMKCLPGLPSQSVVLWDLLPIGIKRITRGQTKITVSAWMAPRANV
jgi:hypothetical protein